MVAATVYMLLLLLLVVVLHEVSHASRSARVQRILRDDMLLLDMLKFVVEELSILVTIATED